MIERHLTPEEIAVLISMPDAPEWEGLARHVAFCPRCAIQLQRIKRTRAQGGADAQEPNAPEPCAFNGKATAQEKGDETDARNAEREAMLRIQAYYGIAPLVLLFLMPRPAVTLRDGREEGEHSTGFDGILPEISIEYAQQGNECHYTIALNPPGACIDLFDLNGYLLASYGEGTRSLLAPASARCLVLNERNLILLHMAKGFD